MKGVEGIVLTVLAIILILGVFFPGQNYFAKEEPNTNIITLPGETEFCTVSDPTTLRCNRDYRPVCGSDGITYPNACIACQNKAPEWVSGTCETILAQE